MYSNIHIILSNTSHPGNIGATARAMKVMNLSQLSLVLPAKFPHAEATAMAAGADDILAAAQVTDDLQTALKDKTLVIGASARTRALPWPLLAPRECAEKIVAEAHDSPVAVLFGCERSGLSNEELALCDYHVHIPTNSDYASLNLAAAVQVLAYEIHMTKLKDIPDEAPAYLPEGGYPSQEEQERLFEHLANTLEKVGFLDPKHPKLLMTRFRRLFARARLERLEVNILRGFLSAIDQQTQKP